MRHCEEKGKSTLKSTFTTSFVPRQLLLSSASSKSIMAPQQKKNSGKPTNTLSSQDRDRLLHTICEFLELNGFHKTLKKFHREADIEKDSWKNCSLNLEEMFQEHLRMCNDTDEKVLEQKDISGKHTACVEAEEITKENRVDNGKRSEATLENETTNGDPINSKKKKKSKSADTFDQVNAENHLKTSEHQVGDVSEPAEAVKNSKKKKQKDTSEPSDKDFKEQPMDILSMPSEPVKKSKDKKKKHKGESEVPGKNVQQKNVTEAVGVTSEKADDVSIEEKKEKSESRKMMEDISNSKDEVDEAVKGLKKRKKSSSDDIADNNVEERATNDPKRRKMDDADKSNEAVQPPKTPNQAANGSIEKAHKQDKTKEHNGSAEPTSVKAFQRVKAEEVKFIDDRLKDNSYWAKDGADSGYGAKAQEILGQVRGRRNTYGWGGMERSGKEWNRIRSNDIFLVGVGRNGNRGFRHEKTKKKRGTYRGGQIDLQSHSIKFNYDDEDDE
ncbi:hypothetical protein Cgig2_017404 [Carnegiea gigantea]|uniref:Srp40 C-terminal domain-containing protein n=1 Tax=Carnegiea gigantea TaxID=171969 RepID=A0A9Q1JYH7_9CARY|nr:hypothetical protein Cgig2_017404 [Carnegiea gigantea]